MMDPISCANVNGSQYCWVPANAVVEDKEESIDASGAYLFPLIQHYDKDCYNCSLKISDNPTECNDVDLEILLFFDPERPTVPHFVKTHNDNLFNTSDKYDRKKFDPESAGLSGLIYLNFYQGVNFLNKLFYKLPNTHCVKPVAISKGLEAKNKLACGRKFQQGLVNSKKTKVAKAAQSTFCYVPPEDPQESYYRCRYTALECVSTAFAEAAGQSTVVSVVLGMITVFLAVNFLGVPKVKTEKEGDEEDFSVYLLGKALKLCKTVKEEEEGGGEKGKEVELVEKTAPRLLPTDLSEITAALKSLQSLTERHGATAKKQEAKIAALEAEISKTRGISSTSGITATPAIDTKKSSMLGWMGGTNV